jgi:transposase-like protein
MAQHYLLSAAARSLDPEQIFCMSEEEAHERLKSLRWEATDGEPVCPREGCGCDAVWYTRRVCPSRSRKPDRPAVIRHIWRCKLCDRQFSVTTGTIFQGRKLSFRRILRLAYYFSNNPKSVSSIFVSQRIQSEYKTAFVNSQKLREALAASQFAQSPLNGVVEIDATYVGGHRRSANLVKNQRGRGGRNTRQQKCITVMRQRGPGGRSVAVITRTDGEAVPLIRRHIGDATICSDYAPAYNALSLHYEMVRIDHSNEGYSVDGRHTNGAESFFARLKRATKGTHHRIAGPYTHLYANELCWREDHRRISAQDQFDKILKAALHHPPSARFRRYWDRKKARAS